MTSSIKELGNMNPDLAELFRTKYKGKMPVYYSYTKQGIVSRVGARIKGLPKWFRIIVAIIAYLIVFSVAMTCVMLLRRRQQFQYAGLEGDELGPGHKIVLIAQRLIPQKRKVLTPVSPVSDSKMKPPRLTHVGSELKEDNESDLYSALWTTDEDMSTRTLASYRNDAHLLPDTYETERLRSSETTSTGC